jgi:hypothetical protein
MRILIIGFSILAIMTFLSGNILAQNYAGSQYCETCHSSSMIGGTQYTQWSNSLHSKIHLVPDDVSIRPLNDFTNGLSISMGSGYNNAQVIISKVGSDFFAQVGAGGATYKIAWTYGWGYKQRYLVKIDTSYYILPIQYNLAGYLNNGSGTWASYTPSTWFNTDGTPKATNVNTFRKKSWDKNCMGCHVTAGRVESVIVGADTSWRASWANNSSEINIIVGCESCHGPSGSHTGGPGGTMHPANLPTKQAKIEVCGQCHNRASSWIGPGVVGTHEYPKNELDNTYFNPADTLHPIEEFMNFSTPPNTTGGPGTWPDLVTARQHHQQYQEMLGTAHYNNPFVEMTCFTCHVSHSNSPNAKLVRDTLDVDGELFAVRTEDNTLCLSCHATFPPFENIPKSWVADPVVYHDSIGAVVNVHSKHSVYDPTNTLNSGGIGRCSSCHMTHTATTANPYDISTHTFNVVSPGRTLQYVGQPPANGMLNSCAVACHRNPDVSSIIPGFGITDASLTNWSETTDIALADTLYRYWQLWGWTGVKQVTTSVPQSYQLSQNYPNPFNPSTKIMVDVSERSDVRLVVYSITGEEVATLMFGEYEPGRYEATWNGRDDFGFAVSSGVYLYRLEAGKTSLTKKMLLVK